MKPYKDHIDYLKNNSNIPSSRYFIFDETSDVLFNQKFKFYQSNLVRHHEHHGYEIAPAFFYFIDNDKIEAIASPPKDGLFLIGISYGLIDLFDRKLNRYFNIDDYKGIRSINAVQKCIPNSIGEIMFQTLMHFTFYHELGHLIQFSNNKSTKEKEENLTSQGNFDEHLVEADADLFAALAVGTHLYQYFEKNFSCTWTKQLIEEYLSILSSSIFCYFLSLNEYNEEIYFEKKSHPHPIIRLFYSLDVIVDYFLKVLKHKNKNYKIDVDQVISNTFDCSEIMITNFFDERKLKDFSNIYINNKKSIKAYKNKLKKKAFKHKKSSVYTRNELAKNNNKPLNPLKKILK